jgi:hypothetical protein
LVRIVVVQHPHKLLRKYWSLLLVELCIFGRRRKGRGDADAVVAAGNNSSNSDDNKGLAGIYTTHTADGSYMG